MAALAAGKLIVAVGLVIAAGGLLLWWGVPLGRLPGDVVVRRGAFTFYLPITTAIIASVVVTIVMAVFKR